MFAVILDWLRFKKLLVPKNMELKDVQVVAEYFGIQDMVKNVNQEMEEKVKEARVKVKLPDGWICLEVGGTQFKTRRSTLQDPCLNQKLLESLVEQEDGTYLVDLTSDAKVSVG